MSVTMGLKGERTMPRNIDADKLKAHYAWWANGSEMEKHFKSIFDEIINLQPTVEAVDVVRCENCKYYCEAERMCNDTNGFDRYWKPTDFCSYGKRRDDVEETD